jgi:hypothetical protein
VELHLHSPIVHHASSWWKLYPYINIVLIEVYFRVHKFIQNLGNHFEIVGARSVMFQYKAL